MRLAIGIVGCGRMARVYCRHLNRFADLYFVSGTQSSADRLDNEMHGCGTMPSLEVLLQEPAVAGVLICSPGPVRSQQIQQVLAARRSVLVEPPICLYPQELSLLDRVIPRSSRPFLMAAENTVFAPVHRKIRDILHSGRLGRIRRIHFRACRKSKRQGWRGDYAALLLDGVHPIAQILDLMQEQPVRVHPEWDVSSGQSPGREVVLSLTFASGASACLDYSRNTSPPLRSPFQHGVIECERGRIVLESRGRFAYVSADDRRPAVLWPDWRDPEGFVALADAFVAALRNPQAPILTDFQRTKRDLALVFQALASPSELYGHRSE